MKLNKNIAISESGFVFNPSTGDSFSTNAIGIDILHLLQNLKSDKETITNICKKYEVEPNVFEKDLQDFYGILQHFGLMEY